MRGGKTKKKGGATNNLNVHTREGKKKNAAKTYGTRLKKQTRRRNQSNAQQPATELTTIVWKNMCKKKRYTNYNPYTKPRPRQHPEHSPLQNKSAKKKSTQ